MPAVVTGSPADRPAMAARLKAAGLPLDGLADARELLVAREARRYSCPRCS